MISAESLDSAADFLVLECLGVHRNRAHTSFMVTHLVGRNGPKDFFGSFIAEIDTAQHEKGREHPGKKIANGQGSRKQNKNLVPKRAGRNPGYDSQFALGRKSEYVSRCNGRVVDDDSGRFGARFGSLSRHVVKRRRCHLCNRSDIVEQPEQSNTHRNSFRGLPTDGPNCT